MKTVEFEKNFSTEEQFQDADYVVGQVLILQKQWPEFVTECSREELIDLYKRKLLKIGKIDDRVVATFYKKPLKDEISDSDKGQVYRIGGLATDKSKESVRVLVNLIEDLVEEVLIQGQKIIAKTDNVILGKYLKKLGMKELTFEQMEVEFPEEIELYLRNNPKTREDYLGHLFYVNVL